MGYLSELRAWLGNELDQSQKIRGTPSAGDDRWAHTTSKPGDGYVTLWFRKIHFAFSRKIRLNWIMGIYDSDNGQIRVDVLDDMIEFFRSYADNGSMNGNMTNIKLGTLNSDTVVTSAAAHSFTVPAGEYWKVFAFNSRSDRNPRFIVEVNPAGADPAIIIAEMEQTALADTMYNLIGTYPDSDRAGTFGGSGGGTGPLELAPGDIITVTEDNFVAADVRATHILYKVFT